jgi:hypothetical protein
MQLSIVGCPDKKIFKPYVERAVHFFAKELITNKRVRENCFIQIKFDDTINDYGSCTVEDYNTKKQPREFLIEVHPGIGARTIIETIAHEMVHVKQHINNETNDDLSHWLGRKVNSDEIDYWIHPWEIDAHGREIGLVTKFAIVENLWEVFDGFKNPAVAIQGQPLGWKI